MINEIMQLRNEVAELRGMCANLGRQIVEMKNMYESAIKEIAIIKEGENI